MTECKNCGGSGRNPGSQHLDCRECDAASERTLVEQYWGSLPASMEIMDAIWAVYRFRRTAPSEQARDAQLESIAALLPGTLYMDQPDGGNVLLIEQFRRMGVDAARYRHLRQEMPGCMRDVGISRSCDLDFWLDGADADSYIDASIASQQKGGQA